MSKLEERQGAVEIDEVRLEDVSGGPIYMEIEGIKGDVTLEGSSLASGMNIALGDGSVRLVSSGVQ
jgi:hypothetical protein